LPLSKSSGRRLFWPLLFIGVCNSLDFLATRHLVVYGDHLELNPFMCLLVGTPFFAAYKLVLVPLGLLFLWRERSTVLLKYMGALRFTCAAYGLLMLYLLTVFYA
jgi:hypothetical protein